MSDKERELLEKYILLNPMPGSHIKAVAQSAIQLSKDNFNTVVIKFNGVFIPVSWRNEVEEIEAWYDILLRLTPNDR